MLAKKKKIRAAIAILVVGVSSSILFALQYITGTLDPFYIVASESMVPTLNVGDLLIIQRHIGNDTTFSTSTNAASFDNLKVGDIILLKNPHLIGNKGQALTMVHRVAQLYTTPKGDRIVRTKGDHNPASIPKIDYPILKKYYIGKVIYDIPKVGLIAIKIFTHN